jgi:hypothetical protein
MQIIKRGTHLGHDKRFEVSPLTIQRSICGACNTTTEKREIEPGILIGELGGGTFVATQDATYIVTSEWVKWLSRMHAGQQS